MGADIHGIVQIRHGDGWRTASEIEDGRNYWLFSALADVRNYSGIVPIDKPRGLPEDIELGEDGESVPFWRAHDGSAWLGEHSRSWFTLKELKEWDGWDQPSPDGEGTLREALPAWMHWMDYISARGWVTDEDIRIVIGFDS